MEYELYIDVFFLENFMMDYILLLLVRRILKCSATLGNIALGALAGSVLMCMAVACPLPCPVIKFFLFHAVISVIMLKTGLRIPWNRKMVWALFVLYTAGFLTGGVMEYLSQYTGWVKAVSLFFALAVGSYYICAGVLSLLSHVFRPGRFGCTVDLYWHGRKVTLDAVIDTGNSLRDPLTGDPVSVIDKDTAGDLFGERIPDKVRYIPYRSIGKTDGLLPAVRLEKLCIHEKSDRWVKEPLVGISGEDISTDGMYRMIVHPDL